MSSFVGCCGGSRGRGERSEGRVEAPLFCRVGSSRSRLLKVAVRAHRIGNRHMMFISRGLIEHRRGERDINEQCKEGPNAIWKGRGHCVSLKRGTSGCKVQSVSLVVAMRLASDSTSTDNKTTISLRSTTNPRPALDPIPPEILQRDSQSHV